MAFHIPSGDPRTSRNLPQESAFLPTSLKALLGLLMMAFFSSGALAYPGCTNPLACNYDADATENDGSCDFLSCLTFGCTNPSACNFDPEADVNNGSCEYSSCAGCLNPAACDYDPTATLGAQCFDFTSCYGCTNDEATNYDADATQDDGSCIILGCTFSTACNYNMDATQDDGSCDFFSCLPSGCINASACNYDPVAIIQEGDCEFPETGYDCDGNCLVDTDGDGVCDAFEIPGCTDANAFNFDADATEDDGSCEAVVEGCLDSSACNYNAAANTDDGSCDFESCVGCLAPLACNYDASATIPGECIFPESGYDCDGACLADADGDGVCDPFEVLGCTNENASNYDEDATENDGSCVIPGCTDFDACNYDASATVDDGSCDYVTCTLTGCTVPTACNYDPEAFINDGSCEFLSCLTFGCTNPSACNFDPEAFINDGSCEYVTCAGCLNPAACDYDPTATLGAQCFDFTSCYGCTNAEAANYDEDATQDDGSCILLGCTIVTACNYDMNATQDDGSCDFLSCLPTGCINSSACNYDPIAVIQEGECEFPETGYDCEGNCLVDSDGDGVCDPFEIAGCTDEDALNYSPTATEDDGSCEAVALGCTDVDACNYDSAANTEDNSCEYTSCAGCISPTACNYDSTATIAATCEFPESGYDCDGNCLQDTDGDGVCNPFEIFGCTNPDASNYDETATENDGSCIVFGCTEFDACNFDPTANTDDGSCDFEYCLVEGCTNPNACNFDPLAYINDGSCDFLSCIVFGCINPSACNFDPEATLSNGSCEYISCSGCLNPAACDYDPTATIGATCNDFSSCYGCTDEAATNYDESATQDDGSCLIEGCTIVTACNYDSGATLDDGSCDFLSCLPTGCINPAACNFDPVAVIQEGECEFPDTGYDCEGNCLIDSDGDGVCDPFEIEGCTDATAINFNADATEDNGSCIETIEGCLENDACNYNSLANTSDNSCEYESCVGCISVVACNYDPTALIPGDCEYPEVGYDCAGNCLSDSDGDGTCDQFEIQGCTDSGACNFDPQATEFDGSCEYITCLGCTNPNACNYDDTALIDDNSCEYLSCIVFGCNIANACNYNPEAVFDDGSCEFSSCAGCMNPEACDFDPDATISATCSDFESCYGCLDANAANYDATATQDGGNCVYPGCTVDFACNYDASANSDDGSCDYTSCAGCLNPLGCNYDAEAEIAAECTFPPFGYDCEGECVLDSDGDGVCDPFEIEGCTDASADNYDSEATDDDGSCFYIVLGCLDPSACNFNDLANTSDESCTYAEFGLNCDGSCISDADGDGICDPFEIPGCQDAEACNYMEAATDPAPCDYADQPCETCSGETDGSGVVIADTTAPAFTSVPADVTIECSDDLPSEEAVASDACGNVTITSFDATSGNVIAGNYVITRTFTATDDAGNSSSATQIITVQDTTAPAFTFIPADYAVECSDEIELEEATAEDNCSAVSISVSSEITDGGAAGVYTITRTFTASDASGNSTTATQVIDVQNTIAPEFTFVPADFTVECSDNIALENATAVDNCGGAYVEVTSETIPGNAAGNYVIVRTFTATDDAGNSSSATQTITVQDTTAPEFTFVPVDYTVECSDEMPMDDATASDNCGEVTIEVSSETTAGDAAGNYVIVRTFTATDDAGNSSSATQTITVQDTTAPEFTFVPADYTVECSDEMPMDDATASDNCGEVTIEVSSETTAGDAAGNYVITRTFTATDDAGNSSSATQTITVQDTTAPAFTFVPADYTVECSDEMPMEDATASDNCGEVTIEVSSETTAGDAAGNYVITRTFTATDDAGNSSSATQTITVQDTTAPEFTFVPADYTVECSDEMPMDDATASDNCGEVTIEVSSETTAGDAAGNYVITRTFTATDDAGNSSSATQTITVQDTTAPEFTFVPADYTVECSDEMPMEDATASDNCGEVTIEVSSETTAGDAAGNYVITRTFTATDDAGNSSSATQTITVQDTTAPEFTFVPADYTVECSDEMPMDDATASDNCGEVTIEVSSETTAGDAAGNYVITRTFTATDDAGNSSSATQTITVQDTTAPAFTFVPADYTVECSDEMPMDDATASDNCGEVTIEVSSETTAGDAAGNYVIVRTFTATDDAGNSSSATQTITVQDTTAPEFTFVPADYTVECSDEMPMDDATASDNCGEVTIEVSSETTAGDAAGNYVITRTFTATDDAGNSSSATQTITVQDTTAPAFIFVPADYTVECSDEMPMDDATASDNCGEVTIEVSSETTAGDAAGNYVITRTFTATDDAGNSSSATQTITVQDTTAPAFTFVPADYTVECSDEMPMDDATASDNCGEVTIEVSSETTAGDAAGNYVITRTFTATDDAGNSSSATQTITVQDTTAPAFTFVPADYTVECSDEMPMDDATASDNCGEVTIEVSSETTAGDAAGNYVITRTFTATDDAGNSSSATQTITVQDTTAPAFTFVPADYTVECSDEMPMDDATASDNCGEVTIEVSSETTAGDAAGNYVITRTFTATDDAGNSSSATQTITVQDTTAPEFTFVPADYTVECSDEMPMDDATASDNCGEVTIEVSSETTAGDAAGNYVITRTFTATDDAGNSSSATQTITVQDTTAPEFIFVPADYTVECSDEMPMDDATASDNCGEVTIEVSSETTAGDAAGNYVITRTFTATDDAGNSSSATQTITVQDTTAPAFTFVPADYTVECSDEMPMDDATASDNCGEVTIEVSSETTAGDAAGNYVITRTFTATDDAGNSSSATQTITVQDTTAPAFTFVPADYTVECSDEMPMDDATASDNCGEVTIEVSSETTAGDAAGNYVITRTFTATDDAGNSSSATQTITVQDTTAPEFTFVPADYTVECSDEMPMDDATASDNCGEVTIEVSSETTAGDAAGNYVITRTFTATDDAGNSSSATQTITVQDTTAPAFTFVPADYTVECSDEMPMDDATASDNCGEVTIEVSSETTAGDAAGNYVITRTFTATDDAGNSSSATQTITVQDTTAPAFTFVPADYTVECSDEMPMDDATASDNCGEVTIEVSSETTAGDAAGNYVITRTFTATDDAGNSSSATQTITVQDTTAPEFTFVPSGFDVTCSSELPMDFDMAEAQDNCGEVSVTLSSEEIAGDNGAYVLMLTYTASDDAGNTSEVSIQINVGDTVPEGDCDCNGNQLDALGECGGDCLLDSDNDGICDLFEVFGCTDESACNFMVEATTEDGSCTYPDAGFDCDGACLNDADGDGICDEFEIPGCDDEEALNYDFSATDNDGSCEYAGCTDNCACNYNADAVTDDGSCVYDCTEGCIYPLALNYNADATVDDGSCAFQGCMDETYSNYNPYATVQAEGDCSNEPSDADLSGDGEIQLDDLLNFLQAFGLEGSEVNNLEWVGICYVEPISDAELLATVSTCEGEDCCVNDGCSYPGALNFDPLAMIDHGTCLFPGCTDSSALNFDPLANIDDNTCLYQACPDFNGDGLIQVIDLMDLLLVWGTTYD